MVLTGSLLLSEQFWSYFRHNFNVFMCLCYCFPCLWLLRNGQETGGVRLSRQKKEPVNGLSQHVISHRTFASLACSNTVGSFVILLSKTAFTPVKPKFAVYNSLIIFLKILTGRHVFIDFREIGVGMGVGEGSKRNIDLKEKHLSATFIMCPNQGLNL